MKRVLGLVLGLTSAALMSQAALIPSLAGTGPSAINPGATTYFYTVSLAADEQLDADPTPTLVVYDFFGYVDGSLEIGLGSGSFTGSTQLVGPYPSGVGDLEFGDSAAAVNLVITYSGPEVPGPVDPVLTFTADSIFSAQRLGDFQAQDSKNSPNPIEDGTPATNEGNVAVPTGVPEPATMSLLGGSLLGLAALRSRMGKK